METPRRIDLLPEGWHGAPSPSPLPSLALTLALAILLHVAGRLLPTATTPIAAALEPPTYTPDASISVPPSDDCHEAVGRLLRRLPWHEILARIAGKLDGGLRSCLLDAATNRVQISGDAPRIASISDLVLELAEWPGLSHPHPERVEPRPGGGVDFTLSFEIQTRFEPDTDGAARETEAQ